MKQKTGKIIEKIKEAKGCFLKEIQKIDKLLARLIKKKEDKITKLQNERGDTVTVLTEIERIIRKYYEELIPTNQRIQMKWTNSYKDINLKN